MSARLPRLLRSILGLPRWVQGWLVMLIATNLAALWFLDHPIGLWTAIAFAAVAAMNLPIMLAQGGITRLMSFPHMIWLPLLFFLVGELFGTGAPAVGSPIWMFAITVFVVNLISVMFDLLDIVRWLHGEREILGLDGTNANL